MVIIVIMAMLMNVILVMILMIIMKVGVKILITMTRITELMAMKMSFIILIKIINTTRAQRPPGASHVPSLDCQEELLLWEGEGLGATHGVGRPVGHPRLEGRGFGMLQGGAGALMDL